MEGIDMRTLGFVGREEGENRREMGRKEGAGWSESRRSHGWLLFVTTGRWWVMMKQQRKKPA